MLWNNYILSNVAMIFAVGMKRKSLRKDVRKCSPQRPSTTRESSDEWYCKRLRLKDGGSKVIKIRDSEIELSLCA